MKYFLDTEFHEYKKKPLIGKPIDTIELISIGIVSEDIIEAVPTHIDKLTLEESNIKERVVSREYYAICKEFDLKAAWDNEWLRENVLIPLVAEHIFYTIEEYKIPASNVVKIITYKDIKQWIVKYGKTKKQIAEEITEFIDYKEKFEFGKGFTTRNHLGAAFGVLPDYSKPQFYAYYADYDWVVFCWLFGKMIDLPNGFPMYCQNLKQELDRKVMTTDLSILKKQPKTLETRLNYYKSLDRYPKQIDLHNSLSDAKWNKELYKFIKQL